MNLSIPDQLRIFTKAAKEGKVTNLSCFLPYLTIDGRPMNLKKHFQLAPLYNLQFPRQFLLKCGRQVGKSYGIASQGTLQSNFIPMFKTLYIQPRFDQIKYFSNIVMKPFIQRSVLRDYFMDSSCEDSVLMRTFRNESRVHYSYCFTDADRVRGISGIDKCGLDEIQDINSEFIPVIGETMSASDFMIYQYTGTPKTTDNTLNVYWEESSMAEWVIPCPNCKKLNVPSIGQDLLNMIGKETMVCANKKCGKPLDARIGWYEHARPAIRHKFAGYHISQVIHPLHYTSPMKWEILRAKMEGPNCYNKARFWNEVLGEACDEASKLLTPADIKNASSPDRINDRGEASNLCRQYESVIMGVDWTGGGMLGHSTTVIALCGIKPGTDRVDVLYVERLNISMSVPEEVGYILHLANRFNVAYIAHDYTGAGNLREVLMTQAGFPSDQILNYSLHTSTNKDIITYHKPTAGQRESWTIDKPRSLLVLAHMIKGGKVQFPEFESSYPVTSDFLALQEEVKDIPKGGVAYLITKAPNRTDDAAFAIDFACSSIWHIRDKYPSIADAENYKISPDVMRVANPAELDWELDEDKIY